MELILILVKQLCLETARIFWKMLIRKTIKKKASICHRTVIMSIIRQIKSKLIQTMPLVKKRLNRYPENYQMSIIFYHKKNQAKSKLMTIPIMTKTLITEILISYHCKFKIKTLTLTKLNIQKSLFRK